MKGLIMAHAYVIAFVGYMYLFDAVVFEDFDPQRALAGAALLLVGRVFHFLYKHRLENA